MKITTSLFVFLFSLTHKTILHKVLCQKSNISYLLGQRDYVLLSIRLQHKSTMFMRSSPLSTYKEDTNRNRCIKGMHGRTCT